MLWSTTKSHRFGVAGEERLALDIEEIAIWLDFKACFVLKAGTSRQAN